MPDVKKTGACPRFFVSVAFLGYLNFGISEIKMAKPGRTGIFLKIRNATPMKPNPAVLEQASNLGALVRQRRRSQHLRIDDAAALIGVSVDLMSRLENSQGSVRLDKVMAVLDGLGLALMVVPKEDLWLRQAASASPLRTPVETP